MSKKIGKFLFYGGVALFALALIGPQEELYASIPRNVVAENPAAPSWEGSGTETDPYLIGTTGDWNDIGFFSSEENDYYKDAYFKVTADLENVKHIDVFSGHLDGGYNKVKMSKFGETNSDSYTCDNLYYGLIGKLSSEGSINKVNLYLTARLSLTMGQDNSYVGQLVGYNEGSISNCTISGEGFSDITLKNTGSPIKISVGGISGYNNGSISNVELGSSGSYYDYYNISHKFTENGGEFVGFNDETGVVEDCTTYATSYSNATSILCRVPWNQYSESINTYSSFGTNKGIIDNCVNLSTSETYPSEYYGYFYVFNNYGNISGAIQKRFFIYNHYSGDISGNSFREKGKVFIFQNFAPLKDFTFPNCDYGILSNQLDVELDNVTANGGSISYANIGEIKNSYAAKFAAVINDGKIIDTRSGDTLANDNAGLISGCHADNVLVNRNGDLVENSSAGAKLVDNNEKYGYNDTYYFTSDGFLSSGSGMLSCEYSTPTKYTTEAKIINCNYNGDNSNYVHVNNNNGIVENCVVKNGFLTNKNNGIITTSQATNGAVSKTNESGGSISHSKGAQLASVENKGTIVDSSATGEITAKNSGTILNTYGNSIGSNSGTIKNGYVKNAMAAANNSGTIDNFYYIGTADEANAGTAISSANAVSKGTDGLANKLNTWAGKNISETSDWHKFTTNGSSNPTHSATETMTAGDPDIIGTLDSCKLKYYESGQVLFVTAADGVSGRLEDHSLDSIQANWTKNPSGYILSVTNAGNPGWCPMPNYVREQIENKPVKTLLFDSNVSYVGKYALAQVNPENIVFLGNTSLAYDGKTGGSSDYYEGAFTWLLGTRTNSNVNVFYSGAKTFAEYLGFEGNKWVGYNLGIYVQVYGAGATGSSNNITEAKFLSSADNLYYTYGDPQTSTVASVSTGNLSSVFKPISSSITYPQNQKFTHTQYEDLSIGITTDKESEIGTYNFTYSATILCIYTNQTFTYSIDGSFDIQKRYWTISTSAQTITADSSNVQANGSASTLDFITEAFPDETPSLTWSAATNDYFTITSDGKLTAKGDKVGYSNVKITVAASEHHNETTVEFKVTVDPVQIVYTAPVASDLTYSGSQLDLLSFSNPTGGTFYFKLGDGSWSSEMPKGINAGTYNVQWYLKANSEAFKGDGSEDKPVGTIEVIVDALTIEENPFTVSGTYTYDGNDQTPTLTGGSYTSGTDYEIVFADGVNHKNAEEEIAFTVKFKGNYAGEFSMNFDISKRTVTASITGTYEKYFDKSTGVDADSYDDITLALSNVVSADSASLGVSAGLFEFETANVGEKTLNASNLTLTGTESVIANYQLASTSITSETGTISKLPLSEVTITIISDDFTDDSVVYTGSNITPTIKVTYTDVLGNEVEFDADTYFDIDYTNNKDAALSTSQSAPTITITAKNGVDVSGNNSKKFTIEQLDISDATVSLKESLTYSGDEQTQTVNEFQVNDLTVTYTLSNNKQTNVKTDGNYVLKVTGTGNFKGEVEVEYNLSPLNAVFGTTISAATTDSLVYAGDSKASDGIKVQIPTYTLKVIKSGDEVVIDSSMYSIDLKEGSNGKYGDQTIVVTFSGNFTGSDELEYTIAAKELTVYSGATKEYKTADPESYIDLSKTIGLLSADDFEDVVEGNFVRATGENVGSYSFSDGTLAITSEYSTRYTIVIVKDTGFTITPRTIVIDDITLPESLIYDGTEKKITITIDSEHPEDTGGRYTLVEGEDYTIVQYQHSNGSTSDCTSAGTITAQISYSANFKGVTLKPYEISKREVTISGVTAEGKVYDATTNGSWTGTPTLNNVIAADATTAYLKKVDNVVVGTATFATKNVGSNVSVVFTGFELDGDKKNNYILVQPTSQLASITKAQLSIDNYTVNDKVYDSTTVVDLTLGNYADMLIGVISGDDVTMSNLKATYSDKNVGVDKAITFTCSLSGTDAGNYELVLPDNEKSTITQKEITITGLTSNDKIFDGTDDAELVTTSMDLVGIEAIDTDLVRIVAGEGNFSDMNAGVDKVVTYTGFTITGRESDNYVLSAQPAQTTATISALTIGEITWSVDDFKDNGQVQTITAKYSDVNGQVVDLVVTITQDGVVKEFKDVGDYLATISSNDPNYALDPEKTTHNYSMKWVRSSHVDEATNKEDIKVSSENGIDPTYTLVVEFVEEEKNAQHYNDVKAVVENSPEFGRRDQIMGVYDVSLIDQNNIKVQPDGEILVYMLIPEGFENGGFSIYHNHEGQVTKLDYTIENGYAVVRTSQLSEFIFVNSSIPCYTHWIFIPLCVLFVAFVVVWWGIFRHRDFVVFDKDGEFVEVDYVASGVAFLDLIVCILLTIFRSCTVCDVFMILNWVFFGVAVILFSLYELKKLGEWIGLGLIAVGKFILKLLGINSNVEIGVPAKPKNNTSLQASLAAASASGAMGVVSKKLIVEHLKKHGKSVKLNTRPNMTKPGKGKTEGLPLPDTHYVVLGKNQKTCFTYVYEDSKGNILLLVKTCPEHFEDIKKSHKDVSASAFPKVSNGNQFYSIPIDKSFTAEDVYGILDDAINVALGNGYNKGVEKQNDELSLKESLTLASTKGSKGITSKKAIVEHLKSFGKKVELNSRPNMTKPGKGKTEGLPLADTHYVVLGKGKKVCFSYIYEDANGNVLILAKTSNEHFVEIKKVCKHAAKSNFPKVSNGDLFYSIPVDGSLSEKDIFDILDKIIEAYLPKEKDNTPKPVEKKVEEPKKPEIEPVVVEPKPEPKPEPVVEQPQPVKKVKQVHASEAQDLVSDDELDKATKKGGRVSDRSHRVMVNVDTISDNFKNGETVTLEELKKRVPGFDKKATYYKVCARGFLDKELIVDADEFSVEAAKMIVATGGKIIVPKD